MVADERQFVDWVADLVDTKNNVLDHDEDAVAIKINNQYMVINIDGWVASTDRPEGMSAHDVGVRAVANAASDVIAKGARPSGMVISMSLSGKYKEEMKAIIQGFHDASIEFEIPYLGGDMNQSTDLVIDVTVWGITDRVISRSNAKVGEDIYWIGPPLGETSAALGILTENWEGSIEKALEIMGKPKLFYEFLNIPASAAIDCSDGLARTLHLLAKSSSIGIQLDRLTAGNLWVEEIAASNNHNIMDLILFGGEELGIVFTIPKNIEVTNALKIGEVSDVDGVYYRDQRIPDRGWDHFIDM